MCHQQQNKWYLTFQGCLLAHFEATLDLTFGVGGGTIYFAVYGTKVSNGFVSMEKEKHVQKLLLI